MLITLRNEFHHTSCRVRGEIVDGVLTLSRQQILRTKRLLCPFSRSCTCGTSDSGTRGPQEHNGRRFHVDCSATFYER